MTMTRTDKAEHEAALKSGGRRALYIDVEFASPTLRQAAIAERGHANMTRAEYADKRMGRGALNADMVEELRERVASVKRRQRVLGGRRLTGFLPGTKRPASWTRESVERCLRRR